MPREAVIAMVAEHLFLDPVVAAAAADNVAQAAGTVAAVVTGTNEEGIAWGISGKTKHQMCTRKF